MEFGSEYVYLPPDDGTEVEIIPEEVIDQPLQYQALGNVAVKCAVKASSSRKSHSDDEEVCLKNIIIFIHNVIPQVFKKKIIKYWMRKLTST